MKLDLHGLALHDAWRRFKEWIYDQQKDPDTKSVIVVTGQGEIHKELPRWCDEMSFIRHIDSIASAGAYHIFFYKKRRK